MASNVGQRITQYEVVELLTKAFNPISNIDIAVNGIRAAGIWPLDATKFDEQFLEATYRLTFNQYTQAAQAAQTSKGKETATLTLSDTQTVPLSNVQTPDAQEAHASEEKGTITPEAQTIKPMCQIANST